MKLSKNQIRIWYTAYIWVIKAFSKQQIDINRH